MQILLLLLLILLLLLLLQLAPDSFATGRGTMAVSSLLGLASTIALASYLKVSGASYPFVVLGLIASSVAQIAVYLGYSSLIYRWYLSPTKDLPHPKVCSLSIVSSDGTVN